MKSSQEQEGSIQIKLLDNEEMGRWNAYVNNNSQATFCHRAEWHSVLQASPAMKTHYLYAEQEGVISGILPLGEIRSLMFGHTLVSTPFCVYGGVCSDNAEVGKLLLERASSLAEELHVDYLEVRNTQDMPEQWSSKDFYYTFQKKLLPEPEANFEAIPRKQRAMVRKGIANGLESNIDEDIDDFYHVYSTSVKNLGTPVYSKQYFTCLKESFAGDCEILTIRKNGKAVSSVLNFYHAGSVLPYYGGGLPEARNLKAHDFMYWELMRRSCEKNIQLFDFGRSIEGTGSFSFKKNWGFTPAKLYYAQRLIRASHSPDYDPNNSKYRLYIKLWQKLPLTLANFLGPLLSRGLA
ncbi:MAG: FemAB family PEP-CTERM system-associated protein [Gammaproteobacteria bacterium]|nr:FemAB family PEP-CTERM system-associated protein [Gammaproteobacteria bacterium]